MGHETCLSKFKILIISWIFSKHNGMKVKLISGKELKIHKYMKVKHAPEQSMGQRNNKKNKNILKYIKMEIQHRQTYGKLHKS